MSGEDVKFYDLQDILEDRNLAHPAAAALSLKLDLTIPLASFVQRSRHDVIRSILDREDKLREAYAYLSCLGVCADMFPVQLSNSREDG